MRVAGRQLARIAVLDDDPTGSQTVHGVAAEFAARTGVDALAVAVGNVHGYTPVPVRLDLGRLRAIDAVCPCALVLHGASGLPEEDLLGAIAAGVVKVNINAELRRAHLAASPPASTRSAMTSERSSSARSKP